MLRDSTFHADRPSPALRWTAIGVVLLGGVFAADPGEPHGGSQALGQGAAASPQERDRMDGNKSGGSGKAAPASKETASSPEDAAAGGDKIIEGVGWKNVRIGMTKDDVIRALGKPEGDSAGEMVRWQKKCIMCKFGASGATEISFAFGFKGALSSGVKIGSSVDEMRKAYGQPQESKFMQPGQLFVYTDRGVQFVAFGNQIGAIAIMKGKGTAVASEPLPAASPAAPAAAAAAAGEDPDDEEVQQGKKAVSETILEGVGWKNLRVGMSKNDAIKALGKADANSPPNILQYDKLHIQCGFFQGDAKGMTELRFLQGFSGTLSNGIRIGSASNDLLKIYGEPSHMREENGAKYYEYSEKGVMFWSVGGKITMITVAKPNEAKQAAKPSPESEDDSEPSPARTAPPSTQTVQQPAASGQPAANGQANAAGRTGKAAGESVGTRAGTAIGQAIGQAIRSYSATAPSHPKSIAGNDDDATGGMNSPVEDNSQSQRASADDAIIAECEKTLETRPDAAEAHCILANALTRQGRNDEAFIHFQKAQDLKPDYAEAHFGFGRALAAAGQTAAAIAHFQKALELRPDYPEARACLILARHPQSKAAKEAVDAILQKAAASEASKKGPGNDGDASSDSATELKHDFGRSDGRRSYADAGEMIQYTLPANKGRIEGVRVFGARYGQIEPPDEEFTIHVLNEDASKTLFTETAPYGLFQRGKPQWYDVNFKRVHDVPKTFWIVLDFKAQPNKGVHVHYDTHTGGKYSKIGLPGEEAVDVDFGGDWMIRVKLAEGESGTQPRSETSASSPDPRNGAGEAEETGDSRSPGSPDNGLVLKYDDGKPEGRKSLAAATEMIQFSLANDTGRIKGIRIHGSRYGLPQVPNEDFTISVLNEDMTETLFTESAPYKLFQRGKARWVDVTFKRIHEVPHVFWISLDFKAQEAKGVYLSYDTDTSGHSKIGAAGQPSGAAGTGGGMGMGMEEDDGGGMNRARMRSPQTPQGGPSNQQAKDVDFGGDWMIRVTLAK